MTSSTNIIDLVRELQDNHDGERYLHAEPLSASVSMELEFTGQDALHIAKLYNAFPAIAAHVLAQEEKLKIAVEALKGQSGGLAMLNAESPSSLSKAMEMRVDEALIAIRSHPLP